MVASPPEGVTSTFGDGALGLQMSGGDLDTTRITLRPFFQGLDDSHLADMAAVMLSDAPFSLSWEDVRSRIAGDLSPIAAGGAIAILAAHDKIRLQLAGRLVDPGREPGFYIDAATSVDQVGLSGNPQGASSVNTGYQFREGRTFGATVGAADLRPNSPPRLETGFAGTWDGYRYRLVYFNDPAPEVGSNSQGGSGSLAWGTTAVRATFAGVEGITGRGLLSSIALSESWKIGGTSALAGTLGFQTNPFPTTPGTGESVSLGASYRTLFGTDWSLQGGASVGVGICSVCLPLVNGFATIESLRRNVFGTLNAAVDPVNSRSTFSLSFGGTFGGDPEDVLRMRATNLIDQVERGVREAERLEEELRAAISSTAPDRLGRVTTLTLELSKARSDLRQDLVTLARVQTELSKLGITGTAQLNPRTTHQARRQAEQAPG